ncbi:hypothetical protein QAD02_021940 [Eretmocerus hayati]|uniref:Uncharacterized protein n=1 Tax=Eretmocerus hayati TaxID=131215 RepID=A0ACC2PT78_9HYME|nr:hypothetical protein QAD02_021940 [Eretmocerus hayati]
MDGDAESLDNPVVISGIAGRFPNSDNVSELQNNLLNQVDCTTEEHDRWSFDTPKVPQRIGRCNNIEKFDRVFFGVHTRLTAIMDPLSRILLECSYEAIMDAGVNPRCLKGANIAVFTATSLSEAEKTVFHRKVQLDGFGIVGCSKAMIPNRISFFFSLNGPSVNIDSDNTGSATALELAYLAIKEGRCDGAIVAGCISCLHPHVSYQLRALGLLSGDGRTRSFDDKADGFTRSDGVAVLYLQKAADAKRCYLEVVNARVEHSNSVQINNSLLFPKVADQVKLMKELLSESRLTPDDVAYLEASGLGIKNADADELDAIDAVYGERKRPLPIGSVKSVIGNATSVATINSIIKIIIGAETGIMPPTLHYEEPNSKAAGLKEGRIYVPTDPLPWNGKYAAVNSTSAVGNFASVILKTRKLEKKNDGQAQDEIPRLIIASGRTEEAVTTIIDYMESRPVDVDFLQLLYDVYQFETDGHLYRGYTLLPSKGMPPVGLKKREIEFNSGQKREIWWIYSGMGSQWVGMGEALLRLPIFEAAIRKCDAVLRPRGFNIFKIITEKDPKMFDQIINSFIGIAAVQIGLTDVLRAVGLEPDYIMGHSVGELGCAYADGCFTAEQMIMAALSRGLASTETELLRGSMAAVGLGYDEVKLLCPPDIDVACHNGPESSTISGPAESMKAFVANLTARGIFAREVPCSNIAYHSRYIAKAGPNLMQRLQQVIPEPRPRSSKWISTSVPRREWNTLRARLSSAEYHTNNLLSPVLFDETSRQIPANAICVEIAPHGLLQAILKRSLPEGCANIALTRRGHPDNLEVLLTGLGKMYNFGLQPQIANLYPKVQYPVGRGTPSLSSLVKWDHSTDWLVNYYSPLEEVKEGERTFKIDLNSDEYQYLRGNVINGRLSIPLSLCLEHACKILRACEPNGKGNVVFEDIKINKALVTVSDDSIAQLTVTVSKGSGKFEVVENEELVVSGTIKFDSVPNPEDVNKTEQQSTLQRMLCKDQFYRELKMRGYQYSGDFKSVTESSLNGTRARMQWNSNWVTYLDGAFQTLVFGNDSRQVQVPLLIRKIVLDIQQLEKECGMGKGTEVVIDKEVNHLKATGLEIHDIKFTTVAEELGQTTMSPDVLKVVLNSGEPGLSMEEALRYALQLVDENTFSSKQEKLPIVGQTGSPKVKLLKGMLFDIPEASSFRTELITHESATFQDTLSIIVGDSRDMYLRSTWEKLKAGKFVLFFVDQQDESCLKSLAESIGYKTIFSQKLENDSILLLRKVHPLKKIKFIKVSDDIESALKEVRSICESRHAERVVIVTKEKSDHNIFSLTNEPKRLENSTDIKFFCIRDSKLEENSLSNASFANQLESDLYVNILTAQGVWATLRKTKVHLKRKPCENWTSQQICSRGSAKLIWTEGPELNTSDFLIKVECSALNAQDIFIAKGSFYTDPTETDGKNRILPLRPGLEFAGKDSRGRRVMGITRGNSLSNFVEADPDWTWIIPDSWTFEDAATVPLSYIVAFSSLVCKAEVKEGEKILLSNVCTGEGLALLYLALAMKCEVFVTYKTDAERKFIKSSCPNVPDNHMLRFCKGNFRDDVLVNTRGQGIDIVICNENNVKSLQELFAVTKRNARVVLISDLADSRVHESVGMEIFLKEISLFSVVPKRILASDSRLKKTLATLLRSGINRSWVRPLARNVYTRNCLSEAFEDCVTQQVLGKIIVKVQPEGCHLRQAPAIPRLYCSKDKSYLIIEGLTEFGLELTDWLITRGAEKIVILSSSTSDDELTYSRVKLWRDYGVNIVLKEGFDTTKVDNVKRLISETNALGAIDAIFDLCRTNEKTGSTASDHGTWDSITKTIADQSEICSELRFFIVCSLTGNCRGPRNQDSYNTFVEDILRRRRSEKLCAHFIRCSSTCSAKNSHHGNLDDSHTPPVSRYIQKFDEMIGSEEIVVELSHVTPTREQIRHQEKHKSNSTSDPEKEEAEAFTTSLYEQYGVHVEGFSYLQV